MNYLSLPLHESVHVISKIADYLLYANFGVFFMIAGFLYLCWFVYLFRDYRKSVRFARRIESQDGILSSESNVLAINLRVTAKRNKFLIFLSLTELIAFISYTLGSCYHLPLEHSSLLKQTGLNISSNCTRGAFIHKIWVDELTYPIIGFLVNFGRGMYLVALGIVDSLLKFIANTYVTQSWQYRRMYNSVICAGIISVFLVILGTLPYTNIFSTFLNIFALGAFLTLLSRRLSFLSDKALNWREQDMLFNVRRSLIQVQKKKKRRFKMLSRNFFFALIILFCMEILISLESVVELYLYFGKCFFPVLFNIEYNPPITDEQLPDFHTALLIISAIEVFFVVFAMYILFLPFIVFTIVAGVGEFFKQWRQNSNPLRFTGNANPEIMKSLLNNY